MLCKDEALMSHEVVSIVYIRDPADSSNPHFLGLGEAVSTRHDAVWTVSTVYISKSTCIYTHINSCIHINTHIYIYIIIYIINYIQYLHIIIYNIYIYHYISPELNCSSTSDPHGLFVDHRSSHDLSNSMAARSFWWWWNHLKNKHTHTYYIYIYTYEN